MYIILGLNPTVVHWYSTNYTELELNLLHGIADQV